MSSPQLHGAFQEVGCLRKLTFKYIGKSVERQALVADVSIGSVCVKTQDSSRNENYGTHRWFGIKDPAAAEHMLSRYSFCATLEAKGVCETTCWRVIQCLDKDASVRDYIGK